jgi:acyl-coenzyme A synthetase/AMP-(fatty) acid ligase
VRLADGDELYPVPCEAIFNEHPRVARTALVGVDGVPVLVVERAPGVTGGEDTLREELLALGRANPLTARISRVLLHPGFPVDARHNAKIHRERLALWARGRA